MRSVVGAAKDDMDAAPPPKRPAKVVRARPKGSKKRRRGSFMSRWADSMRGAVMRLVFWAVLLGGFLAVAAVAGLFSGGHVAAAITAGREQANALMLGAGFTVEKVT